MGDLLKAKSPSTTPGGRNSKRPIDELLRPIICTYREMCGDSFFEPDNDGVEAHSSVAPNLDSKGLVLGG